MKEGTLIWFELSRGDWHPGIVLEYRPDTKGGSWGQSYHDGKKTVNEFMRSPRRGELLVQLLDGQGCGWVDEGSGRVRSPEEHETARTQGTS